MKQKLCCYLLMGLTALILFSCDTNRFKTQPLTLNLATYYEKDAKGEWNLQGVKEMETDRVIITPDNYVTIKADDNFISCIKVVDGVNQIWLYRFDGECIGWFDTLNHFSDPGNYYLATNYNRSYYYFPKTETLINTTNAYSAINYLFLQTESGWKIFSYDGDTVLSLPTEAKIIHCLSSDAKESLYVVSEQNGNMTLLNVETKETNIYSPQDWLRLFFDLKVVKELPHLTIMEKGDFVS